jgi:hypothetical protein
MVKTLACLLLILSVTGCATQKWHEANKNYASQHQEVAYQRGSATAYPAGVTLEYEATKGHQILVSYDLLVEKPGHRNRMIYLYLPTDSKRGKAFLKEGRLKSSHLPNRTQPVSLRLDDHPRAAPSDQPDELLGDATDLIVIQPTGEEGKVWVTYRSEANGPVQSSQADCLFNWDERSHAILASRQLLYGITIPADIVGTAAGTFIFLAIMSVIDDDDC